MMENYIACSLVSVVRFVVPRVRARNARESAAPYGVRAEHRRVPAWSAQYLANVINIMYLCKSVFV